VTERAQGDSKSLSSTKHLLFHLFQFAGTKVSRLNSIRVLRVNLINISLLSITLLLLSCSIVGCRLDYYNALLHRMKQKIKKTHILACMVMYFIRALYIKDMFQI